MRVGRATSGRRRRGAVLVVALICLLIVGAISGSLVRIGVSRRAQRMASERRLQAEWLARSGLQRAGAMLAEKPEYSGETWKVPADELGGRDDGVVTIEVKPAAEGRRSRRVRVVADYPADESRRARETIETDWPTGGDASGDES